MAAMDFLSFAFRNKFLAVTRIVIHQQIVNYRRSGPSFVGASISGNLFIETAEKSARPTMSRDLKPYCLDHALLPPFVVPSSGTYPITKVSYLVLDRSKSPIVSIKLNPMEMRPLCHARVLGLPHQLRNIEIRKTTC
jgi:hypothetical protein